MRRIFIVLLLLVIGISPSDIQAQKPVKGMISESDVGEWMFETYNGIALKIYESVMSDRINRYWLNGKPISREKLLSLMDRKRETFIEHYSDSVIENNEVISFAVERTELTRLSSLNYTYFRISGDTLVMDGNTDGKEKLCFELNQLDTILNIEERIFLEVFVKQSEFKLVDIPESASSFLRKCNIALYDLVSSNNVKVFTDETLTELMSDSARAVKLQTEVVLFIPTDDEDPTLGYDTVYYIPTIEYLKDSSVEQYIFFGLEAGPERLTLNCISTFFKSFYAYGSHTFDLNYCFIKCEDFESGYQLEKKVIEYIVANHIRHMIEIKDPNEHSEYSVLFESDEAHDFGVYKFGDD